MEKHNAREVIVVDWDSKQYAAIDPPADEDDWRQKAAAEREKGRDIHCFSHDMVDTPGLKRWAEQHELTEADLSDLLPAS